MKWKSITSEGGQYERSLQKNDGYVASRSGLPDKSKSLHRVVLDLKFNKKYTYHLDKYIKWYSS